MTLRCGRWKLCSVRLGGPLGLGVGYRRDIVARHWWLDVYRWRLVLIRVHWEPPAIPFTNIDDSMENEA